ncbi:FtsK/SpoIIIE domain-containing protein [Nonomuraea sediminis]|uniref:FtsK/SpoIIIE domain-containing protein n=1 Tax=Nonomuraea sediminis TaxID=2835864 RepID=UPI00202A18D1|nr:FtsK/SpoIIIE domain-containing protein [Nonomuraea sediminis]
MRIMLTVLGEQGDRDVVIDGDDGITVARVAEALDSPEPLAKVVRLPRSRAPYGLSDPQPHPRPTPLIPDTPAREIPRPVAITSETPSNGSDASRHGPASPTEGPPYRSSDTPRRSPHGPDVPGSSVEALPYRSGVDGLAYDGPVLWRNGKALDPRAPARAVLRDGDKVTLDPGLARSTVIEEPGGVAEVRVVGGPAAGAVHRLGLGVHVIGSDPMCAIAVPDPTLAPEAATVRVAPGAITVEPARRDEPAQAQRLKLKGRWAEEVAEMAARVEAREAAKQERWSSPWPQPELAATTLTEARDWPEDTLLTCGSSLFTLTAIEPRDAHLAPRPEGGVAYNRPPRLRRPEPERRFERPREPHRAEGMRLQLLAAMLPAVLGLTLAFVLHQWYFLLVALMTPMIMIGQWWSDRRHGRKQHRQASRQFKQELEAYEEAVERARAQDERFRRHDAPDPAQVLLTATGPRRRLWERRIHDADALKLRVGLADLPADLELTEEQGGALDPPICRAVPVSLAMRRLGVAGVTGPRETATALASWLIGQAATLHSPRDLAIVVLSAHSDGERRWSWVRWLPHCAPRGGEDCVALVGTDPESAAHRVAELAALIDERQNTAIPELGKIPTGWDDLGGPETPAFSSYDVRPYDVLIVLDGAQVLRGLPGMPQVLRQGPRSGVYTMALDEDQRLLPEECATVADCASDGQVRLRGGGLEAIGDILGDLVSPSWCDRVARAIAPIRDVSRDDSAGNLPGEARLLDLLNLRTPTGRDVAARWRARGTTRAVIGVGPDGPFAVDLSVDGPHGLIAGTTGAGKSELLQTLISALAVANRPDQLTFVLIDYKGGAAFKECVRLPHTVGMVSDLDGHLTQRALESLAAEIRRRERLLLAAGAKDIEDYLAAGREPLPRLVLIIDEFAALVSELPDFVSGLVDIARRGRSLGIHLILATQRPAGVVTADIQANTSLRIALRVTEPAESTDVIDLPDAAHISKSTPGRCYVKSGVGAAAAVQTARVGGRGSGSRDAFVRVVDLDWRTLGRPLPAPPTPPDDTGTTDLTLLVDALIEAARLAGVPDQPSPWLDPLPTHTVLDLSHRLTPDLPPAQAAADRAQGKLVSAFPHGELAASLHDHAISTGPFDRGEATAGARPVHRAAGRAGWEEVEPLVFGVTDRPWAQDRRSLALDLVHGGHLLVAGGARSGRSTALRTIAGAIAAQTSPSDVHLHAVDCGSGALLPLVALPHCGAVVTRDQLDRVERLLTRLRSEIGRRQQLLAEAGHASLAEYRQAGNRLPWLVLMVDRWEGYVAAFEGYDYGRLTESLMQILREGPAVGLRAVVTGDRSCLLGQVSTLFEDRLLLRLADLADYGLAGLPIKDLPTSIPPGRALAMGEHGIVSSQIALLTDDPSGPSQVATLQHLARAVPEPPLSSTTTSPPEGPSRTSPPPDGALPRADDVGTANPPASEPPSRRDHAEPRSLPLSPNRDEAPASNAGSLPPSDSDPSEAGDVAADSTPSGIARGGRIPSSSHSTRAGAANSHTQAGAVDSHSSQAGAADSYSTQVGAVDRRGAPVASEEGASRNSRRWRWEGEPPMRVDALPMRITASQVMDLDPGFVPPSPLWALAGAGGDALAPLGVDLLAHGPGAVVAGPPRSGRSSVLLTMARSLVEYGTPIVAVVPRRSPLRELEGALAVLDGNAAGLQELLADHERYVVLVDDAELINPDAPAGQALDEILRTGRDGEHGLIIAGATGDLATSYRGFVADTRKSRTGLLLSVQSPADGDLFTIRLPRGSVGGPPGRGLLVTMGTTTPIQTALPTP